MLASLGVVQRGDPDHPFQIFPTNVWSVGGSMGKGARFLHPPTPHPPDAALPAHHFYGPVQLIASRRPVSLGRNAPLMHKPCSEPIEIRCRMRGVGESGGGGKGGTPRPRHLYPAPRGAAVRLGTFVGKTCGAVTEAGLRGWPMHQKTVKTLWPSIQMQPMHVDNRSPSSPSQ